ncbi:MAG: ZPR1 zinc finger domain-containing protein [Promethearchaeota archaeon]|jgi:ZPR1-related zinc finger protein
MSQKRKLGERIYSFKCPSCQDGIIDLFKNIYDLPDGDKMLILKFECDQCGFHQNDIIPLTTRMDPGIMILQVTDEKDLKSKIYRSPVAKLEIPELELIVEPGPRADFYYTNVEGILLRFESAVSIYLKSLNKEDLEISEIEDIQRKLGKAREGKFDFTLRITDPEGGSYILPIDESKYSFKNLEEE